MFNHGNTLVEIFLPDLTAQGGSNCPKPFPRGAEWGAKSVHLAQRAFNKAQNVNPRSAEWFAKELQKITSTGKKEKTNAYN